VKSTFAFTLIDAAHRGVILGKVQIISIGIRLGNPAVDFIARSQRNNFRSKLSQSLAILEAQNAKIS
jgi:hypothetical protein